MQRVNEPFPGIHWISAVGLLPFFHVLADGCYTGVLANCRCS